MKTFVFDLKATETPKQEDVISAKSTDEAPKPTDEVKAKLVEHLNEIKAYCDTICVEEVPECCDVDYMVHIDSLCYQLKWLKDDLENIYSWIRDHQKGHLPPIPSVEKLQQVIDILKLSDEYKVEKKVIYSSEGKAEKVVTTLVTPCK